MHLIDWVILIIGSICVLFWTISIFGYMKKLVVIYDFIEWYKNQTSVITIRMLFAWYDIWIGVYIDRKKNWIYVFPVPCVGFIIKFNF
jgi:hypothetical protein